MTATIERWGGGEESASPETGAAIERWGDESGQSMSGLGKAAAGGLGRGVAGTLGLPGDIGTLASVGTDKVGAMLGVDPETVKTFKDTAGGLLKYAPFYSAFSQPGSGEIQKNVEAHTGEFYKPQTQTERYVSSVAEMAPGALIGGGSLGSRVLTNVVSPGLAKEGAGQLADKFAPELRPYAEVAGAVAGGVVPSLLARAVTPLPTNAARMQNVNTLRQEGVTDLTAGQVTGRKPLQYLEAERGRGAGLVESQKEQFTRAVLRRAGIDSPRISQEVVDDAFTRIGQQFDDLAARNVAVVDRPLVTNTQNALNAYNRRVSQPNRVPAVQDFFDELRTTTTQNGGQIPGDIYQSLRSRMETEARALGRGGAGTHDAATAIRDMRHALDDAMERSIARTNQGDLGAWRNVRNEYRNMLVIEKTLYTADDGLISPAKLSQATQSTHGARNYARGHGDFAALAAAGRNVLKDLPNSGTAGRLSAQNLGVGISTLLGGTIGGAASGGPGAAAGMIAGAALPRLAGRAATSAPGRAYLSNQLLTPNLDPRSAALVDLLLSMQRLPDQSAPLRLNAPE